MIKITFPDGSTKEYEEGVSPADIAKDISQRLYKNSIAAEVNGQLVDLNYSITQDATVKLITLEDDKAPNIYRHTMSHIMAQAVIHVFGKEKVKLAIGPVIEDGFYYDFDIEGYNISEEDFPKIEEEMKKIIDQDITIIRKEISKAQAKEIFKDQPYKLELLDDIDDDEVSVYIQGDFIDLCRGPHLPSTGYVKHFKLLSVSGAYWRGDEKNKMLQRIYGTAFAKKKDLDDYLNMLEEAKRRDHRKLGPQLNLFMLQPEMAPGMPFILPNGKIILNELMNYSRQVHKRYGYSEVETPQIMNIKLWHQSGHWDHYKENMFFTEKEDMPMAVKPMNCPGHILIYKNSFVSYKDLPIRMFEFGKVHRYERSGTLHGLFRVRAFTQDDAHIFCTKSQMEQEIIKVIELTNEIYSTFGFNYEAILSTMPDDHMGDIETWERATQALKLALEKSQIKYKIAEGDGAFYGPKIDFHVTDSIGRKWQCTTIQLDFQMPERFEMVYANEKGEYERPVMIHRAIFGSLERFFGILIENFAGEFPTWLAPIQVSVVPVSEKFNEKAKEFARQLEKENIRTFVNDSDSTVSYKIRNEQMKKIPYMIVFGEKEMNSNTINVRTIKGNTAENISRDLFINKIKEEISSRSLNLSF
ncbi:MAG TPA: threonine--tRNA ligase [Defluviitoga tunisiensis]|jgi:threonyl-tRNA synthetase|nr:threonine--tRNA ligase [Defluviitoga tunisiensis]HOB55454.1 threonine--tRNA ligase [Defluviitoga tunisiensis]HOP34587.1 threonine--tRNA ligase [Defluviitoga tunisiensis]HPZ66593.1 threonine--tRNA ligase [Defluviitoga tunisiensis]HQD43496.1 threonine--tRNA ligase [Defluviitoga tunisiensis]